MEPLSPGHGLKLNTKEDAAAFVKKLEENPTATHIRFSGNSFGVEASKAVAEALSKLELIQVADFSDMFTGRLKEEIPPAMEALTNALIDKKHLVELNVSDNAFGPIGARSISKLLSSNPHIQVLRASNLGLSSAGGEIIANALTKCMEECPDAKGLRVITAARNRLENPGAQALAKALSKMQGLEEIRVFQNGIRPKGIVALAEALENSTGLRVFDVNDNCVKKSGAEAVARMLTKTNSVEELNVGDGLVGSKGTMAIAAALKESCPKLRILDVSYGPFNNAAAFALVDALGSKTELERLEVNGNGMKEEGMVALQRLVDSLGKPDILSEMDENDDEMDSDDDEGNDDNDESDDENANASDNESDNDNDHDDRDVSDLADKISNL